MFLCDFGMAKSLRESNAGPSTSTKSCLLLVEVVVIQLEEAMVQVQVPRERTTLLACEYFSWTDPVTICTLD